MSFDDDLDRRIQGFMNRKKYPVLNEQILADIEDDELEQAIIDYVLDKIEGHYDKEYEIVTSLSEGFQAVYCTFFLEAEVDNGGFNQYFWNSSGEFATEALDGLRLIGANEHAALMEAAIKIYAKEEPLHRRFRLENTLEAFRESYKHTRLNEVDRRFYKLEALSPKRIRYIREHPEEFRGD
ncbi:MAG TPA: DUF4375 domain-containing protein [Blastocatellia bacterium]|nr:DUF4375 domain-containing protein [Blastocatellia bacterium]